MTSALVDRDASLTELLNQCQAEFMLIEPETVAWVQMYAIALLPGRVNSTSHGMMAIHGSVISACIPGVSRWSWHLPLFQR